MGITNFFGLIKSNESQSTNQPPLQFVVDTFIVRWNTVDGRHGILTKYPNAKAFTDINEAVKFKETLEYAFKILEETGPHTKVEIQKK